MPEPLLRALELSIGRRVDGLLAGDHRSHVLGRGSELAQVRPYEPGDDVRLIDWNVTARTREPHIRVQLAERVLVTWVVLDQTPSMGFGTADRRKADVAMGVALALGHAASVARQPRRADVRSAAARRRRCRPGRAARASSGCCSRSATRTGPAPPPSWRRRSRCSRAVARQRALVAVVSDFRGPRDWRPPLLDLAARHDVLAVEIRDPREDELVDVGEVWFSDPGDGWPPSRRHERREPADALRGGRRRRSGAQVAADLAAARASHVVLSTRGDWLRVLAAHLGKRR